MFSTSRSSQLPANTKAQPQRKKPSNGQKPCVDAIVVACVVVDCAQREACCVFLATVSIVNAQRKFKLDQEAITRDANIILQALGVSGLHCVRDGHLLMNWSG
jgi:hypothetical protein